MSKKVKNRLNELMIEHRYDSTSLGKKIKIDRKALANLRAGNTTRIEFETLLKICQLFKVKIGEFLYIGE